MFSQVRRVPPFPFTFLLLLLRLWPSALAQRPLFVVSGAQSAAVRPVTPNTARIPLHANFAPRVAISGNLPAWLATAQDAGPAPDTAILRLDLTLTRAPEVQSAFDQLLADQQTPGSPMYHVWLKPAQIGELYGPNQADLDQLTVWLTAQGFHIDEVTPSRLFVRVSAPAGTVAAALGTEFRQFALPDDPSGKLRLSAASEPRIPAALSVLVGGIAGLSDALEEPMHRLEIVPTRAAATSDAPRPNYTSSSTGNHYVTPGDFATLYNVPSTYTGAGQKIAIIGRSRVNPADITNFESSVGLPAKLPNVIVPPTATDPGIATNGDQGEATLDVQRVLGTAPGAQADLVIATSATGGIRTAIQYNVQTLLDPVMTISFGACEAAAGRANVDLYTQLFAQAAAEGISVFVSSGDSGAAGCDTHSVAPPATAQIASINYICSSGFATCVGGTEFAADFANPAAYWSSTNTASRASALFYIPEGAWNEPTRTDATGKTTYVIGATGGGSSVYVAKPTFQTGPGVPADGFRDTPDVSFSSSGHDPYFGCYAQTGGGSCVRDPATGLFSFVGFSGTSAAAPSLAAVAALLNQKLGAPQGNLNALFYRLANGANNGVFHDTTIASSGVGNCTADLPSLCNNSTPSTNALTGGLAGYLLTPGFDLATGWGSLDIGNFLLAAASTGAPTTTTLTGTSGNIQLTTPTVSFTASVAAVAPGAAMPTGTVQFFANGAPLAAPTALISGSASLTLPNNFAFGSFLVTAAYSGDTAFDASNSAALTFNVVPGTAADAITLSASPANTTTAQLTTFTAVVTAAAGGAVPTGNVIFSQLSGGLLYPITTGALVNGSVAIRIVFGGGSYVLQAVYPGDATYRAATSAPLTIVASPVPTTTVLTGPASLAPATAATLTATVSGLSPYFASTALVTFFDNGAPLGSVTLTGGVPPASSGIATFTTPALPAGTHRLTASFAGDTNTLPSTSAPLLLSTGGGAGFTIVPTAPSLTLAAGATQGNTDLLTVTSFGGFTGPLTVACAVAFNGAQAVTDAPVCALSGTSLTLAAAGTAATTLTVATTLPQAGAAIFHAQRTKLRPSAPFSALCGLVLLLWPAAFRRRAVLNWPRLAAMLLCAGSLAGLPALAGCGSSSTATGPAPVSKRGTTPGSYTVSVTAAGPGAASTTSNISLTVQ